jgi:hypothetical protein
MHLFGAETGVSIDYLFRKKTSRITHTTDILPSAPSVPDLTGGKEPPDLSPGI